MIHICFGRWLGDPQDLGKGTSADPYRIYTPQQLYDVRNDLQGNIFRVGLANRYMGHKRWIISDITMASIIY